MPRPPVILTAVLIVAGALLWFVPWATTDRVAYTGTPAPPPYQKIAPVRVGPGDRLCLRSVALDPATRQAVFLVAPGRETGPALRISVRAHDYAATSRAPGGYTGPSAVAFALPAPRRSAFATVCLRTAGPGVAALQGTSEDRVPARATAALNGRAIRPRVSLLLTEGRERSLASRPGELADHVSAFKPGYIGRVTLALLALAVLIGVPLGVVLAVREAVRPEPLD